MEREKYINDHYMQFFRPNLVYLVLRGDVNKLDAQSISRGIFSWVRDDHSSLLVDVTEVRLVGPESRRELLTHCSPAARPKATRLAIVGATARTRVLTMSVVAAAVAMNDHQVSVRYFPVLGIAAEWIGLSVEKLHKPS
jgi:hypothetical protein